MSAHLPASATPDKVRISVGRQASPIRRERYERRDTSNQHKRELMAAA